MNERELKTVIEAVVQVLAGKGLLKDEVCRPSAQSAPRARSLPTAPPRSSGPVQVPWPLQTDGSLLSTPKHMSSHSYPPHSFRHAYPGSHVCVLSSHSSTSTQSSPCSQKPGGQFETQSIPSPLIPGGQSPQVKPVPGSGAGRSVQSTPS